MAAARPVARSAHNDPIRPPIAIPASTTASITLAASVVLNTYIVRKRNQTTSRASSASPERKAQTRSARRGNASPDSAPGAPSDCRTAETGEDLVRVLDCGDNGDGSRDLPIASAMPPATPFNIAAIPAAP